MEAKEYILLSYARETEATNGEYLMNGSLTYFDGVSCRTCPTTFSKLTYKRMMSRLSELLQTHRDVVVHVQRTDSPTGTAMELPVADRKLLRDDPVAFINATSHPPVHVVVGGPKPDPRSVLRAGYPTLADTFGEFVYGRVYNWKVESPFTGRWTPVEDPNRSVDIVWVESEGGAGAGWMRWSVTDLLETECQRFYLPREWNPQGPWISREDLKKRLEEFRSEKATAEKEISS